MLDGFSCIVYESLKTTLDFDPRLGCFSESDLRGWCSAQFDIPPGFQGISSETMPVVCGDNGIYLVFTYFFYVWYITWDVQSMLLINCCYQMIALQLEISGPLEESCLPDPMGLHSAFHLVLLRKINKSAFRYWPRFQMASHLKTMRFSLAMASSVIRPGYAFRNRQSW